MARLLLAMCMLLCAMGPGATVHAESESPRLAGLVFDTSLYSSILGHEMPYRIYLPPEYLESEERRFPVLYMLHGAGGNYTEWGDSNLPEQLDDMIVQGTIQPMIAVMPEGNGRTYFANWDNGPRYSDYLAEDVVAQVDARFRTLPVQSARAIGGLSMGGLAAMQVAMRHPSVFGVVGAHSPSIRLEPDPELWFMSGESFLEHNPIWLARNWAGADRMVYWLDVGEDDWWRPNIEELHDDIVADGLNVSWHIFPGTHEAEYWIAHVPEYLHFYSENLHG